MTQDKVGGDPGPGMEANIETNLTEGGDTASHDPATWSGLAVQVRETGNKGTFKETNIYPNGAQRNMNILRRKQFSQKLKNQTLNLISSLEFYRLV